MKRKTKSKTVPFETLKKAIVRTPETAIGFELGALRAELGLWLRSAREEAGLTQKEMAKRAGIDQGDVARLESGGGVRGPTVSTLVNQVSSQGYVLVMQLVPAKKIKGESPLKLLPIAPPRAHA